MRWRLGRSPRPRWRAYDTPPDPIVGKGFAPSAFATCYFLAPYILLAQIYPLPPQFNIPKIANGSKQPPDPTPSPLRVSFPDLRDLNCMGPLTYFPVFDHCPRVH